MLLISTWEDAAACDHLHLMDILDKTLFFVLNVRTIANQIVEVLINLYWIVVAELAPQEMDQRVLEKGDTLVTAIVWENFEKLCPDHLDVRLHDGTTSWYELLLEYDTVRVDHEKDGHVAALVSPQFLWQI